MLEVDYLQHVADASMGCEQPCVVVRVLAFPKPVTPTRVEQPSHPCPEIRVVGFPRAARTSAPLAVVETRVSVTVVQEPQSG